MPKAKAQFVELPAKVVVRTRFSRSVSRLFALAIVVARASAVVAYLHRSRCLLLLPFCRFGSRAAERKV
jgi:hypothetical protein